MPGQGRRVLGGILVGGRGLRMDRPKQLLIHRGRTLIEIVWSALVEQVEQVVVIGKGELPPALARARRLPDVAGVRGPLAGMLAALRWAPGTAWLLAACDLPLASPEAVAWLLAQRRPDRWAVLPRVSERGIEPLLAVYEPQALQLFEDLVREGRPEPRLVGRHARVASPEVPAELAASWFNVNVPSDLAALAEIEDAGG